MTPRSSLGFQLADRLLETFVLPEKRCWDNRLFRHITEKAAPAFEHVEDVALLHKDNFADMMTTFIMQPLRHGAVTPRVSGWLQGHILERLALWQPFQIWESYLLSQDLAGYVFFENDPEDVDLGEVGDAELFRIEFRVTPFFKELER